MQPDEDLAVALTSVIGRLDRAVQARQCPGVTVSEISVLAHLAEHPGLTPVELAALENMRPPSVTRHLKSLTGRGLIEMARHPGDGRRIRADVTDAGSAALAEAVRTAWLTSRIAALNPAQRDILGDAVTILEEMSR